MYSLWLKTLLFIDETDIEKDNEGNSGEEQQNETEDQGAQGGPAKTWGGNGDKAACVFPFKFNNETYSECIMEGEHAQDGVAWCATTGDYDADGKWGHCGIPPSEYFKRYLKNIFFYSFLVLS